MWDVCNVNNLSNKRGGKKVIFEKIIPSIVDNFPIDEITNTIQIDGDSAHNIEDNNEVVKDIKDSNLPLIITKKPPQSMFLNMLDLRYFESIKVYNTIKTVTVLRTL